MTFHKSSLFIFSVVTKATGKAGLFIHRGLIREYDTAENNHTQVKAIRTIRERQTGRKTKADMKKNPNLQRKTPNTETRRLILT